MESFDNVQISYERAQIVSENGLKLSVWMKEVPFLCSFTILKTLTIHFPPPRHQHLAFSPPI